ncbi:hypothetical protein [Nitrobacter sp. TKz-YC01]|uniref:hypothetical protein n=1 Tax=Nitrobacter sp. TKz-YC01 TaxID=3398703 RepID=UPI003A102F10
MPLSPPPHKNGAVIPHDHPEITGNDDVVRRISLQQVVNKGGRRRISSLAFQPSSSEDGGMSIDIIKSIECAGLNAPQFVTTPKWIGSVIFKAGVPRENGLLVGYDPLPHNDHHGEVWGQFSKGISRAIQRASKWFVQITDVDVT